MKKGGFDFGEWVEQYRFWIGGGLLVLILVGCGVLFWRDNVQKPSIDYRLSMIEARVGALENNQLPTNNSQAISSIQTPNIQETGTVAGASTESSSTGTVKMTTKLVSPLPGKVNLNTATVAELDSLPGIGVVYAERIVQYRNANGGFKSTEEVKNVKGIGDKTFEKFKDMISL